jgi:hypothetical protein
MKSRFHPSRLLTQEKGMIGIWAPFPFVPSEGLPMDVLNYPDQLSIVTVKASRPLIRPDGRYAIELATTELGSIAFEVDEQALFALRQAIGEIETEMKRRPGRA